MYSRWNLSRNPFDTNPISLGNLEWFVGRTKEVGLCQAIVAQQGIVLIEGGLGAGTTSFGNVVRFGAGLRTPRLEVGVHRTWNAQILLENVLVAIMQCILRESGARNRAVVKRILPLVDRVEQKSSSAGFSIMGTGGQAGHNVAVTQPGLIPLETLRQGLADLAEAFSPATVPCSFVIQLNNLDLDEMFTARELEGFLNDIRDSLQIPGLSWLLVGDTGLLQFVTHQVPRLRSIITHDVLIEPFSKDELRRIVAKRVAACSLPGEKGISPIETSLVNLIYDAANGSLRDTFAICSKLCLAVAKTPFIGEISEREAVDILAELQALRLSKTAKSPLQKALLMEIGQKPMSTQTELTKKLQKRQPAVSRALKALVTAGLVRQARRGANVTYWLSPETKLALSK